MTAPSGGGSNHSDQVLTSQTSSGSAHMHRGLSVMRPSDADELMESESALHVPHSSPPQHTRALHGSNGRAGDGPSVRPPDAAAACGSDLGTLSVALCYSLFSDSALERPL